MVFKKSRYTPKMLQAYIKEINEGMPEGSRKLMYSPAYGWQGIDEMDADGRCLRNIERGTSRECAATARLWQSDELFRLERMKSA